jgi:hypothetical protein
MHSSPYTPNPILGEPYCMYNKLLEQSLTWSNMYLGLSEAQSVAPAAAAGVTMASPSIPATVGAAEILPPIPATLGTSSENPHPQGKAKEKPASWYSSLMDVDINNNPSNSTQPLLSPMAINICMSKLPLSDQPLASSSRDGLEAPPCSSSPGSDEEPSVVHVTHFTTAPIPSGDVVLRFPVEGQESLEEDAPGWYIPSKTQVNNRQVDGHEGDDEYEPNEDHEPYEVRLKVYLFS